MREFWQAVKNSRWLLALLVVFGALTLWLASEGWGTVLGFLSAMAVAIEGEIRRLRENREAARLPPPSATTFTPPSEDVRVRRPIGTLGNVGRVEGGANRTAARGGRRDSAPAVRRDAAVRRGRARWVLVWVAVAVVICYAVLVLITVYVLSIP